ncbi:hypothetical protein GCM10012287_26680 [Streptomyces daqingensis]|uniref:DUF465 domain-containing protein n=1 Tax=Streptomyces daqingensis TaxID=1472640 RepID=A0ABQ2MC22_9ACTN|nr:DUF6284 family protein [Streptomyces daqingensis]GGO49404.1 hypothetical protein GCM10012287_26680 [Streptomyces daqingensis]
MTTSRKLLTSVHDTAISELEPSDAELDAIDAEMPLILAEVELLDARIAALDRLPTELDSRRVRRAQHRVLTTRRHLANRATVAPEVA